MAQSLRSFVNRIGRSARRRYIARYGYVIASVPDGLRFRVNSNSDQYVFNEIYGPEDAYRRAQIAPLMQGGVVVDIGAHKGFFSAMAAKVAARVIAFEPSPTNHRFLNKTIRLNRFRNVEVRQEAVSGERGSRTLIISSETAARNSFYRSSFTGQGKPLEVRCTTLAAMMDDHGLARIDLLKLDCEGGEHDILLNTPRDALERIGAIALEIHESPAVPGTKQALIGFLEDAGFHSQIYDERTMGEMGLTMALFTRAPHATVGSSDGA